MTDDQILVLASNYLHYDVDGDKAYEWRGEPHELLKFARFLLDYGYSEGHGVGYIDGVKDEQKYPENAWSEN